MKKKRRIENKKKHEKEVKERNRELERKSNKGRLWR